jgi:hypothetical protein
MLIFETCSHTAFCGYSKTPVIRSLMGLGKKGLIGRVVSIEGFKVM